MLVLDASVMTGILLDEDKAMEFIAPIDAVADASICVPPLFWLEVANSLRSAWMRKRISAQELSKLQRILLAFEYKTDAEDKAILQEINVISVADNLTHYDAAYLELAIRKKGKLMTLDANLMKAAKKRKVLWG